MRKPFYILAYPNGKVLLTPFVKRIASGAQELG
jgi:hypothetical protein